MTGLEWGLRVKPAMTKLTSLVRFTKNLTALPAERDLGVKIQKKAIRRNKFPKTVLRLSFFYNLSSYATKIASKNLQSPPAVPIRFYIR
jgi:hypothetical protein